MKHRSSSIGVAALALLLTSALPAGAGKADPTLYTLDASCTSGEGTPAATSTLYDLLKQAATTP